MAKCSILPVTALAFAACTDAVLYDPLAVPSQPNKVAFTGRVCTDNPVERSFPLRVVYLVDNSVDLPVTSADPTAAALDVAALQLQRVNAVRDSVTLLRGADSEFAVVRYGGDAIVAPDGGFTSNTAEVIEAAAAAAVPQPCTPDGCRRVGQAFQLAASLITGDLLSTAKGPRSRTKYVIANIQYGPTHDQGLCPSAPLFDIAVCPVLDGNSACQTANILASRVEELRTFVLDNGGADFQMHDIDIAQIDSDPICRNRAEQEMEAMAFRGGGEYRQVCRRDGVGNIAPVGCSPNNLTLLNVEINSARNVFLLKSFVVTNLSAVSTNDGAVPDSDQDGFADDVEEQYGTDPSKRDTDDDGLGDKVEVLLSTVELDPLVFNDPPQCLPIPADRRLTLDTDGDGLKDCEEALLRLDATLFDSDADGAPDLLEFLAGTNFLADDGLTDSDFDGTPNVEELRAHTQPRAADAKARQELGYLYRENDLGIRDMLFTTQPRELTGVIVEEISIGSGIGNGELSLVVSGDRKLLAWRDAVEPNLGEAQEIGGDGTVTLYANCGGQVRCAKNITVKVTRALLPPISRAELLRVGIAERQCTDFRVRNVTLVETLESDGRKAGDNDVRIYFGEVPGSAPDAFGIFRVAQYIFNFREPDRKTPDVADQLVEDFRFVLFE